MLVEYKPFEPAFYHTDIADWGMALELARRAGPKAKVLVDTGHHLQGTNIEQIVAWLLHCDALGGFHFNDRKYADDDLTLGSIDPYQVFRIFNEILSCPDAAATGGIAYMIDQSHNLKGKVEAMVQTVVMAQELFAKAALVDQEKLAGLQQSVRPGGGGGAVPRGVLDGCAADGEGVARGAQAAGGAARSAEGERVRGDDQQGARREECEQRSSYA